MSNYRKIKRIYTISLIFNTCSLIISVVSSTLLFIKITNIILFTFLFLVSFITIFALLELLIFKIFNSYLKRINRSKVCIINDIKLLKAINQKSITLNENELIYYQKKYHLKTIALYKVNDYEINMWKSRRKHINAYIKSKFKEAREQSVTNRHWLYQINLFTFSDESRLSEVENNINKLNNDRIYEIGKMNVGYNDSTHKLIIKSFNGIGLNFTGFLRFNRMLKLICKTFNISYRKIIDVM